MFTGDPDFQNIRKCTVSFTSEPKFSKKNFDTQFYNRDLLSKIQKNKNFQF